MFSTKLPKTEISIFGQKLGVQCTFTTSLSNDLRTIGCQRVDKKCVAQYS